MEVSRPNLHVCTRLRLVALVTPLVALLLVAESAGAQLSDRARPIAAAETLIALSAGTATTCATSASGTGYCWGNLGERRGKVYRILGADGQPARLRSTSPGWFTLCAQTLNGEAACDPSLTGASTDSAGKWKRIASCAYRLCVMPLPKHGVLPAGPLRAVDTGWSHACALSLDGAAFCWGRNDQGQLGNGHWAADSNGSTGEMVRVPTAVATAYRFAQLSAGENTTCGITEPGAAIYCWGYGQSGQTGDSSVMASCSGEKPYLNKPCSNAVPSRVDIERLSGAGMSNVRFAQVSVGMRLACAVSVGGEAYCWGGNYRCALGRCRESDSPRAHKIPLAGRAVEVGAGYWHACARTADRRVFCWGQNTEGQLGSLVSANAGADGLPPNYSDTTDREAQMVAYNADPCFLGGRCSPAPVEVSPGRRWSALAVGSNHACALAEDDGGIYCWGGTDTAAIGLGSSVVPCVNRSTQWKDVRCQAAPVRVPGLPSLVGRVAQASPRRARPTSPLVARVTASRREVRVAFPRDVGAAWGWSALIDPEYQPSYDWAISVNGMDGPRSLRLIVFRTNDSARRFSSLESLVAAGTASLCSPGMMSRCFAGNMSASVRDRHVELVLRDSAVIARLFGLRPATVGAWVSRPSDMPEFRMDSASVQYVDPRIPVPDAAVLADARTSQRRYEASISGIMRSIASEDDAYGKSLWLAVGDSVAVSVHETRCHYDSCLGSTLRIGDSLWTLDDTSIAGLRADVRSRIDLGLDDGSVRLVGRRPGRTMLRIALPPQVSDTVPSSSPPERVLTREVVVTRAIRRIEFVPHPDSLRIDETIELRVRVIDDRGREYENPPAHVAVNDGNRSYVTSAMAPLHLGFESPGTRTIVVRFGALSDTLTLRVVRAP
jgi:hypothetical protein